MQRNLKLMFVMFIAIFIVLGTMIYISIPNNKTNFFENIDVGINPPKGNPDSNVVLIEFSDFQCPYCKKAIPLVNEMLEEFEGEVVFYYRNFPLKMHENSLIAAEAAECANEQGKFWEYHDVLFENQNNLNKENLKLYAQELELDQKQFNDCFDTRKFKQTIEKDIHDGKVMGIQATPTFFINGRKIIGVNHEVIRNLIEEELEK